MFLLGIYNGPIHIDIFNSKAEFTLQYKYKYLHLPANLSIQLDLGG